MTTKAGTSIIEVVIAAALISMGVVAALALTNHSQKQSSFSQALNAATAHNNQAAEWLRDQKTTLGWATFLNHLSTTGTAYCLPSLPADFTSLSDPSCSATEKITGTPYTRRISFDLSGSGGGVIGATITTTWPEKVVRTTTLNVELSQWK